MPTPPKITTKEQFFAYHDALDGCMKRMGLLSANCKVNYDQAVDVLWGKRDPEQRERDRRHRERGQQQREREWEQRERERGQQQSLCPACKLVCGPLSVCDNPACDASQSPWATMAAATAVATDAWARVKAKESGGGGEGASKEAEEAQKEEEEKESS